MEIFSKSAGFLATNPKLVAFQAIGWIPSLFMLAAFSAHAPEALLAYQAADLQAMSGITGTLLAIFAAAFIMHIIVSTFVTGTSVVFVKQGMKKKASLGKAIKKFMPHYFQLFLSKLFLWMVSFTVITLSSVAIIAGLFSTNTALTAMLVAIGVSMPIVTEAAISIMYSFLPMAVVLENRGAKEGVARSFQIARKNLSWRLLLIFIAGMAAGFAVLLINFIPHIGAAASNLLMLVVGAFFIAAWAMFYFKFERKVDI